MATLRLNPISASGSSWTNTNNIFDGSTTTLGSVKVKNSNYSSRALTVVFDTTLIPKNVIINSATLNINSKASANNTLTIYADVNGNTSNRIVNTLQTTTQKTYTADITNLISSLDNILLTGYTASTKDVTLSIYEIWIDIEYENTNTTNFTLLQGYVYSDGSFSVSGDQWHSNCVRTDFIDITDYNSISIDVYTTDVYTEYVAFYDKDKKFIKYINNSTINRGRQSVHNKEDNVAYVVFDMYSGNGSELIPSEVNVDVRLNKLCQGYLIETGGFSTYDYDEIYHARWLRTDYIDIRDKDEVTIDVLSNNGIFIDSCQVLDTNKKFKKYIDINNLKSFTYQKESGIGYIVLDFHKDMSTDIFPTDLEIDIKFSSYDEVVELKNIKIGNSVIQNLYLGNNKVVKMYLGDNLIFGKVE